jgi:SpoVK/Ycf46/Vps4 family AAA+-type ATPase
MERLNRKISIRKRLLIGTVNSLAEVPEPLRRPGRFDEIVEFHPLTKAQRKSILVTYAKEFGVGYSDREFDSLAAKTDNMTGAYLKEIAMRAKVVSFNTLCVQVEQMKRICNMTDEEPEGDDKPSRRRRKVSGDKPRSTWRVR